MERFMAVGNRLIAQDENGGAEPTLYAALADIPGDSYAGPGGLGGQRGAPKLVGRSSRGEGHGRRPPAVGRVRAVDRRHVSVDRRVASRRLNVSVAGAPAR